MELSTSISDSTALITIIGAVDTLESESLLAAIEGLHEDAMGIDIDMERVDYISSAGLRVLLRALDMSATRGGTMKVVKSSEFVREILSAVGFDKLFSVK